MQHSLKFCRRDTASSTISVGLFSLASLYALLTVGHNSFATHKAAEGRKCHACERVPPVQRLAQSCASSDEPGIKRNVLYNIYAVQQDTRSILMSEFIHHTYVSSTCFGPHRSIIRSVLQAVFADLVCGNTRTARHVQPLRLYCRGELKRFS
jgi:hypothetical protein